MSDDRLARALAADSAPPRDAAYTLAVLERAEAARWRAARRAALIRGAAGAVLAAAGIFGLSAWASANLEDATTMVLASVAVFVVAGGAKRLRGRLQRAS